MRVFTDPLEDKWKVISSSKRPHLLLAGEMGGGVVEEVEGGDSAWQSGEVLETSSRRPKRCNISLVSQKNKIIFFSKSKN
jgi:hypothetical protein